MDHPLDNVVWTSLTTDHAPLALGGGLARHYPRDMAPFSAIIEPSADAFRDLAVDLPAGAEARLFRPAEEPVPPGWEIVSSRPILQMVASEAADGVSESGMVVPLEPRDTPAMLALAAAANPGPFGPRTPLLGRYVGIWEHGRLAAMGGERFRLPGFTEVSAICTHPDARGHGYGRAITAHLWRQIAVRGARPFLHVFPANAGARRLYESLGFAVRRELVVVWARPVAR